MAWLRTDANKDSFESSKPGLFTSDSTIKSDVCAVLFAKTSKGKGGAGAYGLVDGVEDMDTWTVWLVHFCRDN